MRRSRAGLWRSPDFVRLWAGQTISLLGSHIGGGALRYAAILGLAAAPPQLSLLAAASLLPALLLAIPAGLLADRVARRRLLIAADVGRALLLLSVPAAFALGALRIEQLYVVAALGGALTVLFDTAYPAFVPQVVRRERLVEANSKLAASDSLAEIAGPPMGGLLVQAVGAPLAVALDALSFVGSALALRGVRAEGPATENTETAEAPASGASAVASALAAARREVIEGLAAVRSRPALIALLGVAATQGLAGGIIGTLYDVFLIRELGLSPALVGLTVGIGGVAALLGAALAEPLARRIGVARTLAATLLLGWPISLLLPLAGGPWALAMLIALQLSDVLGAVFAINALSLRQSVTPDRLLGRVGATFNLLGLAAALAGTLAAGPLALAFGARGALLAAVAIGSTAAAWLLALRGRPAA